MRRHLHVRGSGGRPRGPLRLNALPPSLASRALLSWDDSQPADDERERRSHDATARTLTRTPRRRSRACAWPSARRTPARPAPYSTSSPRYMNATWSATRCACWRLWVTITIATSSRSSTTGPRSSRSSAGRAPSTARRAAAPRAARRASARCRAAAAGRRRAAAPGGRGRRVTSSHSPARSSASSTCGSSSALPRAPGALLAQRVGDVVEDAHRERVRLLEDHAHAPAQLGDLERVDVLPVEQDAARPRGAVAVSSVSRFSERSSVVFPQPEGPISASTSPWRTGSDTEFTAGFGAVARPTAPRRACARWRSSVAGAGGAARTRARPVRARCRCDDHGRGPLGLDRRTGGGGLSESIGRSSFRPRQEVDRRSSGARRSRAARTRRRRPSAARSPRPPASCCRRSW